MQNTMQPVFVPGNILLPAGAELARWAVLACDQFTSQPEYWQEVEHFVQNSPSTYNIILPEVYLESPDVPARISKIHAHMAEYKKNILTQTVSGYIYVHRQMQSGKIREGIIGCVDLEAYSYLPNANPRIRPSEGTIIDRIPPRLEVRKKACLETPHILMLIDDLRKTVIEPFAEKTDTLPKLYDFELMLGGGNVSAWAIQDTADINAITNAILALEEPTAFNARYGIDNKAASLPFALAAGDGNHSLATAKANWENQKTALSEEEKQNHPARFCLVELENIQSDAIEIEPIHRVIFGVNNTDFLRFAAKSAEQLGCELLESQKAEQSFTLVADGAEVLYGFSKPLAPLTVGSVEALIEGIEKAFPGAVVDYIHGDDDVRSLAKENAVGILLPDFEKSDLFRGIALGGVLPKKTFSMGHAPEKRYYLECRAIT